jgi:hypothetical protein
MSAAKSYATLYPEGKTVEPILETRYIGEEEILTPEQLSELWPRFPYMLQKSLNKLKNGLLPEVSFEELIQIRNQYLNNQLPKNDQHRVSTDAECVNETSDDQSVDELRSAKRQHIE